MTWHCFRVALFAKLTWNVTIAIHLDCACVFVSFGYLKCLDYKKNGMFMFNVNSNWFLF